jgi:hypothetical protein
MWWKPDSSIGPNRRASGGALTDTAVFVNQRHLTRIAPLKGR